MHPRRRLDSAASSSAKAPDSGDSAFSGSSGSEDAGNRGLERSVGAFDQTHTVKLSTVFDLPFGKVIIGFHEGHIQNVVIEKNVYQYSKNRAVALG